MFQAQEVADYIVWSAHETGSFLSNLKLQKLLYYVQSWHLAINHVPLFLGTFEAWPHGPALPDIYANYKRFSFRNIDEEVREPVLNEVAKDFINEVLDEYGHLDARRLEYLTHREDPWIVAFNHAFEESSTPTPIDERLMESFYGARLQSEQAKQEQVLKVQEAETTRHEVA